MKSLEINSIVNQELGSVPMRLVRIRRGLQNEEIYTASRFILEEKDDDS